jgi:hypothetical protein
MIILISVDKRSWERKRKRKYKLQNEKLLKVLPILQRQEDPAGKT